TPDVEVLLGKHHDQRHGGIVAVEGLDGPHEQWPTLHGLELLGYRTAQAFARTSGDDDGCALHGAYRPQGRQDAEQAVGRKAGQRMRRRAFFLAPPRSLAAVLPQMISIASP